jgi:hypothetical protein
MSYVTTVKHDDVKFDIYADVEPADHSVGYTGNVDIYCVCFEGDKNRTNLSDILSDSFMEYVHGEVCEAVDAMASDEADERAEREWEDREDR